MPVSGKYLGWLLTQVVSDLAETREEAAETAVDWGSAMSDFQKRLVIRLLSLMATAEQPGRVREAQLNAIGELFLTALHDEGRRDATLRDPRRNARQAGRGAPGRAPGSPCRVPAGERRTLSSSRRRGTRAGSSGRPGGRLLWVLRCRRSLFLLGALTTTSCHSSRCCSRSGPGPSVRSAGLSAVPSSARAGGAAPSWLGSPRTAGACRRGSSSTWCQTVCSSWMEKLRLSRLRPGAVPRTRIRPGRFVGRPLDRADRPGFRSTLLR